MGEKDNFVISYISFVENAIKESVKFYIASNE